METHLGSAHGPSHSQQVMAGRLVIGNRMGIIAIEGLLKF